VSDNPFVSKRRLIEHSSFRCWTKRKIKMSLKFLDELLGPLIVPPRTKRRKNKTITVAIRNGETRHIIKDRYGWPLPPTPGYAGSVSGHNAYKDAVGRWIKDGWEVKRIPNT
jgi:hypothetical protein